MEELQNFSVTLKKIFQFLGVDPIPVPELKLNTRTKSEETIPFYKELMECFFLKEIELLEDLMGWNCDEWKNYPTANGQNKR
jgi:hypothetical protein